MLLRYERKFLKELTGIRDAHIKKQIEIVLERLEEAEDLSDIAQVKAMKGKAQYYRIRTGDYRIGVKLEEKALVLLRVAHRKDIYKVFP